MNDLPKGMEIEKEDILKKSFSLLESNYISEIFNKLSTIKNFNIDIENIDIKEDKKIDETKVFLILNIERKDD